VVQASLGKKQDTRSKIISAKRPGGMAQAEECLPKKKKKKEENPANIPGKLG
jgi:hypothetical protein